MLSPTPILVSLLLLIDCIPLPPPPAKRPRGKPRTYTDRLILKALVVMIIRRLYSPHAFLAFLAQPEMAHLRPLLSEDGQFPTRRTWERRMKMLPTVLPAMIGCLGRHLVVVLQAWATHGRAAAIDSTALRTGGGIWHKKHREAGEVSHSTIDTEAGWSKSGWHGWWYGWKLHLAVAVSWVWIPLAAELTAANTADNLVAPLLLRELPLEVRYLLGDTHYNTPELRLEAWQQGREIIATRPGPYPHRDGGAQVRSIFHKLRSWAIEPFNGLFKNTFEWGGYLPVKGLKRTQLIVLGAIFIYQLVLLYQHEKGVAVGQGIKALLRAA